MVKGRILTLRVSAAVHRHLLDRAADKGTTISEVARGIIEQQLASDSVMALLTDLEIARRFRELYAQTRLSNYCLDALARNIMDDKKYDSWQTHVRQQMDQEAMSKDKYNTEGVNKA